MSASWVAHVSVLPKAEVLDPQGAAILGALRHLEFARVTAVRGGRLFELHIDTMDRAGAEELARDAARRLLCNPVVETFTIRVEAAASGGNEADGEPTVRAGER